MKSTLSKSRVTYFDLNIKSAPSTKLSLQIIDIYSSMFLFISTLEILIKTLHNNAGNIFILHIFVYKNNTIDTFIHSDFFFHSKT